MVLGHSHRNRSSTDASREDTNAGEDETVVDDDQGNVLSHIISQLRPGADLSRVTLPTFILEPRSMLERITNFMAHPETLLPMPTIDDPVKRFVAVTKFYLSGWHIKPPGVKKPLNPILGETFTGYWDYPDGTRGYYISEQTSHHPPKSSYFYMAPEHNIRIDGTLKPRSKFLGNSVGSFMEGIAIMRFLNRNEKYFVTQPNMYARGILFGKMKYELGDHASVKCPETGLEVDIDFKVKGWMGGSYNALGGYIKDSKGKNLYELSGFWHGEMFIKDLATGKKEVLFDATHAKETPPKSRPISEQSDRESQKLWLGVTKAIKVADQRVATDEKSRIEDQQREEAAQRGEGVEWQPKLFRKALGAAGRGGPGDEPGEENLDWVINATIDSSDPKEATKQILAIAPILPGQEQQSSQNSTNNSAPPKPQQEKQSSQGGNDLIDFGQNDRSREATPKPAPQQSQRQFPAMGDMQEALQPSKSHLSNQLSPKVTRQDSVDGGVEEFVDADS